MSTTSYQHFVTECEDSGYKVDDELVEVPTAFVILGYSPDDQYMVSIFHKGTNSKKGDFGNAIIETNNYNIAFNKFLSTIRQVKKGN